MSNIISFPHIGNYYIPIKYVIEKITKCQVFIPRLNNKETIKLGSRYSPNEICMPFKYNLGNYIESLNNGSSILIQAGGGCRYGYYAELQEQILKELGYKFKFINLIKNNHISIVKLYKFTKSINKRINIITFLYYLIQGILMIIYTDKLNNYIRINQIYTENTSNKVNNLYKEKEQSIIKIIKKYHTLKKELISIKKENPSELRILLIGELFSLMDPEASNNVERKLLSENISIYRYTDLTYLLLKKRFTQKKILTYSRKYLKYRLGADGSESVYYAIKHCNEGIDGIIHIKSYGCVPEINAIPILNQISEDYQTPILYLSFDGENNISNIDTKIEAFIDLIKNKKKKIQ